MPKSPRYTAKEIIKMLESNGWREVSQSGSHRKFRHPAGTAAIVVPVHNGNLKIGTQNQILKTAGLK
jgi:predicted RNA binding protein YcfA (HicA-like mRNA interferase family)